MSLPQFRSNRSAASVSQTDIGHLRVMRLRAVRGAANQSAQWPATAQQAAQICVVAQLEGRCTVEQSQRQLRLTPESWALWDMTQPPQIRHEGGFDQVALFLPRAAVGGDAVSRFAFCSPLSGHRGTGRLVFQSVRALADELPGLAPGEAASLSEVVVDLVRMAVQNPSIRRHTSATSLWE